jgi:uncharacterized protein YggU (UPF0235/DUF167 family)
VTLHVRVTPNAGVNRIDGTEVRDDGTAVLRVRVTAVPDKGKANTLVTDLLAKALAVPKTAVLLVQGQTARLKTFEIAGDPAALAARIDSLG